MSSSRLDRKVELQLSFAGRTETEEDKNHNAQSGSKYRATGPRQASIAQLTELVNESINAFEKVWRPGAFTTIATL